MDVVAAGQNQERAPVYSERDYCAEVLADDRSEIVGTYLAMGKRNPAWDADAQFFLDQFCLQMAYGGRPIPLRPEGVPTARHLEELGAALIAKGCDDPLVECVFGMASVGQQHMEVGAKHLRAAVTAMEAGDYPPDCILLAASLLRQMVTLVKPDEMQRLHDTTERCAVKVASLQGRGKIERYFALNVLKTTVYGDHNFQALVNDDLRHLPNVDPWIAKVFAGEYEINAGWDGWGNTNADQATADQLKALDDHMAAAREDFLAAMKLEPDLPGPAADMITVTMIKDSPQQTTYWYEQARKVMFDDEEAYEKIMYALLPRWDGSYDQMLRIGMEAAQSERYDTQAPIWLIYAVRDIEVDSARKSPHTYGEPAVYREMQKVFAGYEAAVPEGRRRDWCRTWNALLDWKAGQYGDARKILDQLGNRAVPEEFTEYVDNGKGAISQVYAMTGPLADRVVRAETAANGGKMEEAAKEISEAAAELKADDPSGFFIEDLRDRYESLSRYAAGDWVDLLPKKDVTHLWMPKYGQWSVDSQQRLKGECNGMGLMLMLRMDLGPRYEVTMKVQFQDTAGSGNQCGLALDDRGYTFNNGLFLPEKGKTVFAFVNGAEANPAAVVGEENVVDLQFWDNSFTATVNGKQVDLPAAGDKFVDANIMARLTLLALKSGDDATVYVTQIKAKKLTERPAGLP